VRAIYSGEKSSYEITVNFSQELDGYFLLLKKENMFDFTVHKQGLCVTIDGNMIL